MRGRDSRHVREAWTVQSKDFLCEGQPQKYQCSCHEQQKHDNHECQPLALPRAPRGDAVPDLRLPSRGALAGFCTSVSTDRYGHPLNSCALDALIVAQLTHKTVTAPSGVLKIKVYNAVTSQLQLNGLSSVTCASICPSAFVPSNVSRAGLLTLSLCFRACTTTLVIASCISSLASSAAPARRSSLPFAVTRGVICCGVAAQLGHRSNRCGSFALAAQCCERQLRCGSSNETLKYNDI